MAQELETFRSSNTLDDQALVDRAKTGDAKAFEKLLKKYRKSVYYMLLKMVNNPNDAEDLTQEAFAKAFSSLEKFDTKYAFSTWLFRIATNNCIDFIRKKKVLTISIDSPVHNDEGDEMTFDIRDNDLLPNEVMTRQQRKEYLQNAVDKLPGRFKLLIEKRYFQELSYEEIAVELEMPLGTVKAQLFRAREMLMLELKDISGQM